MQRWRGSWPDCIGKVIFGIAVSGHSCCCFFSARLEHIRTYGTGVMHRIYTKQKDRELYEKNI